MRRFLFYGVVSLALAVLISAAAPAAWRYDPEIREYMKETKKRNQEEKKQEAEKLRADANRRLRPYQTYEELNAELDQLLKDHPDLLSGGTYGRSVDGRELRYVRLSTGPGDKPEILVTGNIHAQELAGGQMAMELLRWFAENYGKDCNATRLADAADLYFIPVLNPDEMARAALTQSKYGATSFIRKNLHHVDLNRNFPYPADGPDRLKDEAGSPRRWDTSYRGTAPLSEPETASLIRFADRRHFILALNYHTSGGLILYCPGTYPKDTADTALMREMALAYQAEQFDKYEVKPAIDLYPTLGALDDYLYHRYGTLSLTVEVGKDMGSRAFDLHNGTMSPVFWAYNVYNLEQEAANNLPGALALIEYAIKIHEQPELLKWEPSNELWVGEPPRPE